MATHSMGSRRRRFGWAALLVACLALVIAAAGCGGASSSDSSSSDTGSTSGDGSSGGGAATTAGKDLQKVSVRLDWLANGSHTGFYVAQAKGFYKDVGLDVDVREGQGSTQTVQLVGSGKETFGYVASNGSIPAVAQGAPVTTVATIVQKNPAGVLIRTDKGVSDIKQLQGQNCEISPFGYIHQMMPAFYAKVGLPQDAMHLVSVDAAASLPTIKSGKISALCDMLYEDVALKQAGVPVKVYRFSDYGLNTLAHGIIANNKTIESDPDLVQRFVSASLKGFQYSFDHRDESIAIEKAATKNFDAAQQRKVLDIVADSTHTAATKGKPLGWMAQSDWQSTVDLMQKYLKLDPSKLPDGVSGLYTNKFIPSGQ